MRWDDNHTHIGWDDREDHIPYTCGFDGASPETSGVVYVSADGPFVDVGYTANGGIVYPPGDVSADRPPSWLTGCPESRYMAVVAYAVEQTAAAAGVPTHLLYPGGGHASRAMQASFPVISPARAAAVASLTGADPEPAEQAPPPGRPDILDQIDAAVDSVCACGCRRSLDPGAESAWFATPECQQRWQGRHATDPDDVYARADAAGVYVGLDHLRVPLDGDELEPVPPSVWDQEPLRAWQCPDPYGAGYRRNCPHCDRQVVPRLMAAGDVHVRLECPSCGAGLGDPVFFADVTEVGEDLHLRLSLNLPGGTVGVGHRIPLRTLMAARHPEVIVRGAWAGLEHKLARFGRQWAGRRAAG